MMQGIHYDHPSIYNDGEVQDIAEKLPAFAITAVIPLVDITEETGPTRMWPGSHLVSQEQSQKFIDSDEFIDPVVSAGDCILFDYRLLHTGLPNRSELVRPILYNVYYRPWFRDIVNYSKQNPLLISEEAYRNIPDRFVKLFSWAAETNWSSSEQYNLGKGLSRNSPCHCDSGERYKHCHGKLG